MGFPGLGSWFYNFSNIYDEISPASLADIPNPYLEYSIWWMFKSVQLSSFLGGMIVHPIYRYYLTTKLTPETTTNNSTKVIRNTCRRVQGRILIGGMMLAPLFAATKIYLKGYNREDVIDKCYKIRCDSNGLIQDRATFAFGMLGWYWKRFQGAVDGVNLSILYLLFYFGIQKRFMNPLLTDRLTDEEKYSDVIEAQLDSSALYRFVRSKLKGSTAEKEQ